jgi:hypothetical protein
MACFEPAGFKLCAHFAKLLKKPALLRGLQLRY